MSRILRIQDHYVDVDEILCLIDEDKCGIAFRFKNGAHLHVVFESEEDKIATLEELIAIWGDMVGPSIIDINMKVGGSNF